MERVGITTRATRADDNAVAINRHRMIKSTVCANSTSTAAASIPPTAAASTPGYDQIFDVTTTTCDVERAARGERVHRIGAVRRDRAAGGHDAGRRGPSKKRGDELLQNAHIRSTRFPK